MHVICCVHPVLDVRDHWSLRQEAHDLDGLNLVTITDPADLAAITLAVQGLPGIPITALSLGPATTEPVLRDALGAGAVRAVRVWDEAWETKPLDGAGIAKVLAAAVAHIGGDVVVCGAVGLETASGFVGPAIAEYLNAAQVSGVTKLELSGEASLLAHRRLERGAREVVRSKLPVVMTVDAAAAVPVEAPLPALVNAQKTLIEVLRLKDFEGLGSVPAGRPTGFQHLAPPRPRTKRVATAKPTKALSAAERMRAAMAGGGVGPVASSGKGGKTQISGKPDQIAAKVVAALKEQGIL